MMREAIKPTNKINNVDKVTAICSDIKFSNILSKEKINLIIKEIEYKKRKSHLIRIFVLCGETRP